MIAIGLTEYLGYFFAILIGVSMGLIGGGGSILTVPLLVYLFGLEPVIATSYSLFIVGSTSLVGAVNQYFKKTVDIRTALLFGSASITTVLLTRKFIIPAIPEQIAQVGSFNITFSFLTMALFAVLMLLASFSMIRNSRPTLKDKSTKKSGLLLYGVGIGLVTGFLGAGGGFLLIPALVLIIGLDMRTAIGTSLMIIALNSLIGFLGDLGNHPMDWSLLLLLSAIAIGGIFLGMALGRRIPGARLRKGFGWFVLLMGMYILAREIVAFATS